MSEYKNIFFDADDTLKDFTKEDKLILEKIHNSLGIKNTFRYKVLMLLNIIAFKVKNTAILKTNANVLDTRLKMYAKFLNVDYNNYSKEYYEYLEKDFILFEGVNTLMNHLKENKYNIFFITNNPTCEKVALDLGFDINNVYILEQSVKKHQVMEDILQKNNFNKDETIMIGDNLLEDIYYAKKVGIKTAWINFDGRLYNFFTKFIKPDYFITKIEDLFEIL